MLLCIKSPLERREPWPVSPALHAIIVPNYLQEKTRYVQYQRTKNITADNLPQHKIASRCDASSSLGEHLLVSKLHQLSEVVKLF